MRILHEAGFTNREAARAYRILFIYTFGCSAFGPGPGSDADRERSIEVLRGLPPHRYRTLVAAANEAPEPWPTRPSTQPGSMPYG